MITKGKTLAIIPARGGSKGVPGKNIREIAGKPLIAWTIESALAATCIDRLIVSTDDSQIAEVAQRFNCEVPFMRDSQLACDDTSTIDVVMDAIEKCPGFEWVILLQPTSPLRTNEDIDNAFNLCNDAKALSCASVCLSEQSPNWMFTLDVNSMLKPLLSEKLITRRQDLNPVYFLNGAIYIVNISWFIIHKKFVTPETIAYIMPMKRSIDLDTEDDFLQLQFAAGV